MIDQPPPTHPLLSRNRLKLGLFALNGMGCALTHHPDRYVPTWESMVRVAQRADAAGLEALVPFARWKPFGGDGNPSGNTLETLTWAAGLAALTRRICVMSTIHLSVYHPVLAAKSAATIDRISNGRLALNLVCGWFRPEIELFGTALREHSDRYDMADEWVSLLKKIWTETESFDWESPNFRIRGVYSDPKPIQRPGPLLMNAGGSARGQQFAAQHCDIAFVLTPDPRPEKIKAQVDQYRALARERYGREIQIWSSAYVVQRDTVEAARAYVDEYVLEYGDTAAVDEFIAQNLSNAKTAPPGVLQKMRYELMAGVGGIPLLGSPEDIADRLEELSDAGVDGTLLTWMNIEHGIEPFVRDVLPLIEARGLRAPATSNAHAPAPA